MPDFTFALQLTDGGNASARLAPTVSSGAEIVFNETIPASSTNLLIGCAVTYTKIKAIFLYCTAAATLKTNSSGSPDQTFTLSANDPIIWTGATSPHSNPITATITALYLTCSAGGSFIGNILYDPT